MPFQSSLFLLVFLPVTLLVYVLLARQESHRLAGLWLIVASLIFYGWSHPSDVGLLIGSSLFTFLIGSRLVNASEPRFHRKKLFLVTGIAANLLLLAYFKYASFVLENLALIQSTTIPNMSSLILPLGISFITFQQISYLVDAYRGEIQDSNLLHYGLYISFFPKILAGPIVRYGAMRPYVLSVGRRLNQVFLNSLAEGITVFAVGLFKKVVLADSLARYADPVFQLTSAGSKPAFVEAWGGVLAYTFQIYFDFSGYTDMAIGLAMMFGIVLPPNFRSPYKALSIIDFWHTWHMTLSQFIRDYIYIPLGGNRLGRARQFANILTAMVLAGLWHGANWTFAIWGLLHGLYLIVNHIWRRIGPPLPLAFCWLATFVSVSVAWVWFRADNVRAALTLTASLFGLNGFMSGSLHEGIRAFLKPASRFDTLPDVLRILDVHISWDRWTLFPIDVLLSDAFLMCFWLAVSACVVFGLPTTLDWVDTAKRVEGSLFTARRAMYVGILLFLILLGSTSADYVTFVYSQF